MKFSDFLAKTLLADTDWLVGYDENGKYIRVSKSALGIGAGASGGGGSATVAVQYSANSESWHDSYTAGDNYMRIKAGGGAWSGAIRLCVSAYDIWLRQGNSGSEADFLASLKGEDGEGADIGSLQLSNIGGYTEFLKQVNATLANAKDAILAEVKGTAVREVMNQYKELQMEDFKEVRSLSDDDYITIVTADGLRKVRLDNLASNVAVRNVSIDSLAKSVDNQLSQIYLNGEQDGKNVTFTTASAFMAGTSHLFLNGQRLVAGTDYTENNGRSVTLLNYTPEASDNITFIAVKK